MEKILPTIPAKRYFTIGEVGDLCGLKPHVLRYWEQEFTQLRPMKRRGNRRYYQHHEVLMIRRIRELLYDQGFTISGARNRLQELGQAERDKRGQDDTEAIELTELAAQPTEALPARANDVLPSEDGSSSGRLITDMRRELLEIRDLLLNTA